MKRQNRTSIWVRSFLGTVLLMAALSTLGLYLLYHQERTSIEKSILMSERLHNKMVTQNIDLDLKNLFIDLYLVANHVETKRFLQNPSTRNRADLEAEFLTLCTISGAYDQVRILDNQGMELARVNYNNGSPMVVPPNRLQNKAERYYFLDSLPLRNGEVYVSKFDLNIENRQIELPLKPMIRVSTPVYDDRGERLGIAILNYLGQRIIDKCTHDQIQGEAPPYSSTRTDTGSPRPTMTETGRSCTGGAKMSGSAPNIPKHGRKSWTRTSRSLSRPRDSTRCPR